MKILLMTHNYPPDIGAASFRMAAFVEEFLNKNHQVTVLTAMPNRYENLIINHEINTESKNLKIIRVKSIKQSKKLFWRGISFIQFFFKSLIIGLKEAWNCDIIVATSPQILTAYSGSIISKITGKKFIVDIRDLWPDAMLDLNITTEKSLIFRYLKTIEKSIYKRAVQIVINSPSFNESVQKYVKNPVEIVTNGLDDYIFDFFNKKKDRNINTKSEKMKVLYAGNLGIAQDINILTEIAKETENDFEYILIGNGSQKNDIIKNIEEKRIKNISIYDPVERKELLKFYEEADILFLHLKKIPMFEKTIPSKIFEYVATSRPVIYGLSGVSKEIMDELKGGRCFEQNNTEELTRTLYEVKSLLNDGKWKAEGREILKTKYLRSSLSKKFVTIVEETYEKSSNTDK